MDSIIDHKRDGHAIYRDDTYIKHGSSKKVRKTTKGCHLCLEWKDGTTIWELLAYLKEINPVEVAEYAVVRKFLDAIPYFLKKRSCIITDLTKQYHKQTHKFGIEVPKSWDDCVRLDKENFNTLCQDAVRKEMNNV
jgi:hypothetical protein